MANTCSREPDDRTERAVFNLLQLRLSPDWTFWHEPELAAFRPDFILFHPQRGLFVLEVKGWTADRIRDVRGAAGARRGRAEEVLYDYKGGRKWVSAPFSQLSSYLKVTRDLLGKKGAVPPSPSTGRDQLFGGGVFFPNISAAEATQASLHGLDRKRQRVLRGESGMQSFYKEHLRQWRRTKNPEEDLSAAPGASLTITGELYRQIRSATHPEVVIPVLVTATWGGPVGQPLAEAASGRETRVLDLNQEEVARKYIGAGHRILFGVAGSGKTVILIARARYQAMRRPDDEILVLCFNRSLSVFLQHALNGFGNITVKTFHSWAVSCFPRYFSSGTTDEERDRALLDHLREHGVRRKYDCILIDECQDWRIPWFQSVLMAARNPEDGDLLIVGDGSQSIYRQNQGFTWKSCGVKAQGRVVNYRGSRVNTFRNYRNPPEIVAFAAAFARSLIREGVENEEGMMSLIPRPELCGRPPAGVKPVLCRARNARQELREVCHRIRDIPGLGSDVKFSDVAVLYPTTGLEHGLLEQLARWLGNSFGADWILGKAKNQSAVLRDTVKLTNVQQIKGLEFKYCFLVSACRLREHEGQLLYVALTRATERLFVSYHGDSRFVRLLAADSSLFATGDIV